MRIKYLFIMAVLVVAILCSGGVVKAVDNSALIAQLQAQIAQLTAQLQQMLAQQQGTSSWCYTFNNNLGYSNSGSTEVGQLHTALDKEGINYSSDTGNLYGTSTRNAVGAFQLQYGLFSRTSYYFGYTESTTRAKLNALYGCSTQTICTPRWTCSWGSCVNGYQSQVATDFNNCGLPPSSANIFCTTVARTCVSANSVNGVCGWADGTSVSSIPATNLCSAGTASYVSGSGPWNWTCAGSNGGYTDYCNASLAVVAVNGSCGWADGTSVTTAPTTNLCSSGIASSVSGSGPWNWTCSGSNGGYTAYCNASLAVVATNGVCGWSNGTTVSSTPSTNLCSAGTASYVSGSGPWNWTCSGSNGGYTAYCNASLAVVAVNGSCGWADGTTVSSAPTTNLCTYGTASSVSGSGPWNWTCAGSNGGYTDYCNASLAVVAVNGACGSSNGTTVSSTPSTNLCSFGTASSVSGSGPWNWTCNGSNGGTTVSCSASRAVSGTNGVCGTANGATVASVPTTNRCSIGTASPVSGSGPWNWTCAGSNGGITASCSANLSIRVHWSTMYATGSSECAKIGYACLTAYNPNGIPVSCDEWAYVAGQTSSGGEAYCNPDLPVLGKRITWTSSYADGNYKTGRKACIDKGYYSCLLAFNLGGEPITCDTAPYGGAVAYCQDLSSLDTQNQPFLASISDAIAKIAAEIKVMMGR